MNNIFIIEGIDHVGKTGVIEELRRMEEGIVIHSGMPLKDDPNTNDCLLDYHRSLSINQSKYFKKHIDMFSIISNSTACKPNIYLDRFHLGEYVYSKYRDCQDYKNPTEYWSRTFIFNKVDSELEQIHGSSMKIYLILLDFTDIVAMKKLRITDHNNKYGDKFDCIVEDREDFQTAYEFSRLNKKHIFVNNGYKWNSRADIVKEILK